MLKSLKKIKNDILSPPKVGEIAEGTVIARERSSLFVDLGAKGVGIIYGQEFFSAKDNLKDLKNGDPISAKVVGLETEAGYRELSVAQAYQELAWQELIKAKEEGEVFEVPVKGANKGGLLCQLKGIGGFLPTSQLLPEHFPKVEGADPAKIAQELQKLLGEKIKVKVFSVDPKEKKLILSEKATKQEKIEQEMTTLNEGDEVEGEVSGVTNFGAFLRFGQNLEGLIPASAISADGTKSPADALKIGDKIKAIITKIENSRIYLSPQSK